MTATLPTPLTLDGASGKTPDRVDAPGEVAETRSGHVITVRGLPAPQGSKRAFANRHTGRVQMVESSKRVKPWREAVKHAALDVTAAGPTPYRVITGAVYVETTFTLPRPKGHYGTGRNADVLRAAAPAWPAGKPDIEKLVRSTRDALTDAGVWTDDCLVVSEVNVKTYPGGHPDALPTPGAVIRIYRMDGAPVLTRTT